MTLADLAPHVSKAYADIAPTNNDAVAEYRASVDLDATRDAEQPTARANLSAAAHRRNGRAAGRGDPAWRLAGGAASRRHRALSGPAARQGVREPR